jgi:hypothetical protein
MFTYRIYPSPPPPLPTPSLPLCFGVIPPPNEISVMTTVPHHYPGSQTSQGYGRSRRRRKQRREERGRRGRSR